MLNKYRANYMAGQLDSANAVANQICQRLDSAIIKSQWIDAEELEVIRQKEEQILKQEKRLARARILALMATIIVLSIFFTVYTIIRHRAQRRLADANAQLAQKNEQLMIANARAEESTRMKSSFIQQISHEIRTPLNILSGFTQVITTPGMELDDDTKVDINRQITENTDRITGLVNKMLELSDANSMSVIECTDQAPAVQIASQAVEAAGISQAPHLTFNLQISPEAENTMLTTNLTAASRALTLLLDNAQKFTHAAEAHRSLEQSEQKARAELRVTAEAGKVLFIVEDTGIGVPASEAEHIFEEFVQLDEYYDGTGIGLTVARSLARRLGGDIRLDTSYTAGARFVMHLPTAV
jgi:signal transduction histidine kinase